MLNEIRNFNVDRESLEDMVAIHILGTLVADGYETYGTEAPEWLTSKLRTIKRQIRAKVQDQLEKDLMDARLKLETAKTPQEKKAALQLEIKRLQTQLEKA